MPCIRTKPPAEHAACRKIMYDFEACKKEEFAKILANYQETGTIAGMAAIRKPDALRDIYLKGRAHDYDKANKKN